MLKEEFKIRNIVRLSPVTINRIAAGEVVERPASVVKELVENALDAGATEIVISIEDGGKRLISVSDNGCGMDPANLALAVENHTTSKLNNDDLLNINYFGFRGEAIASIGSVSELTIKSRPQDLDEGAAISVICGGKSEIKPVQHAVGTKVEVRNLFCATPARLKFLRTDRTEEQYIESIINKIAIANPSVAFKFSHNGKIVLHYKNATSERDRIEEVLGKEFLQNSIAIDNVVGDMQIHGYISLPTHSTVYSEQYLYVNNRAIRDRLLLVYIKAAYQDLVGGDKTPTTVLFLKAPSELVDVNVHPSKAEVRFRDIQTVKSLVIGTLKQALMKHSQVVSTTVADSAFNIMFDKAEKTVGSFYEPWNKKSSAEDFASDTMQLSEPHSFGHYQSVQQPQVPLTSLHTAAPTLMQERLPSMESEPRFGFAKAQIFNRYILSQKADKFFIIDQHAAHERICYEQLKQQLQTKTMPVQILAIPVVITINDANLLERIVQLNDKTGLKVERDSSTTIKITEVPQIIKSCDIQELVESIIKNLADLEEDGSSTVFINKILATYACYGSVRGGRALSIDEMNALLRLMEEHQCTGSCNHGRPTYVELSPSDMKKMFG